MYSASPFGPRYALEAKRTHRVHNACEIVFAVRLHRVSNTWPALPARAQRLVGGRSAAGLASAALIGKDAMAPNLPTNAKGFVTAFSTGLL
jgi:hypothetical protein